MNHAPTPGTLPGILSRLATPLVALFVLFGCSDSAEPTALSSDGPSDVAVFSNGGELGSLSVQARRDLAALRRLLAPLHDFETAVEAGWNAPITPCLESPEGGMGYHYANLDFLMNGEARVLEPEALLFEPQKNGRLRFVGVEYIVPQALSAEPPELFGQTFHPVPLEDPIWALHVWVGRHNPSGMFADWNPMVTCEHA